MDVPVGVTQSDKEGRRDKIELRACAAGSFNVDLVSLLQETGVHIIYIMGFHEKHTKMLLVLRDK
ncbi:MAG: hypothetical protein HRT91_01905 [Piscirickettsiaceae bacterium]|nr:hypothetical protein [Piscirickettsiaceae bacterium]